MKISVFFSAISVLFIASCTIQVDPPAPGPKYGSGVMISNEGLFQTGTGTVSYYDPGSGRVQNEIYFNENGFPVGNVLHSITNHSDFAYLVVNNSAYIEVVESSTMLSVAQINGFSSPRYLLKVTPNTAYVTDWFANNIKVVDLNSNTITDSIPTGTGPEHMAVTAAGDVVVTNTGGFSTDSTLTIINNMGEVDTSFVVSYLPNSVQVDNNNKVWVLCAGRIDWVDPSQSTAGKLFRINPSDWSIEQVFDFPDNSWHPGNLKIDGTGNTLYYLSNLYGGKLYKMNVTDAVLPAAPLVNKSFYSLGVDPVRGDVYGADPIDYNQNGKVLRYDSQGTVLDSMTVGIIPGNFGFKLD